VGNSNSYNKGIPDGYVIDLSNLASPQLYFVENELASHDVYSHISEQVNRFNASITTSKSSIRDMLLQEIKNDKNLLAKIMERIKGSKFENLDQLMIEITEKKTIKIVIIIDSVGEDLKVSLSGFKNQPDTLPLERYIKGQRIAYYYEPLVQTVAQPATKNISKDNKITADFDTVVCAAFEDGFKNAYEKESAWWAIRLSQIAREKLKYLAIYEKNPVKEVRHVADIVKIEPYENSGKFKVYLTNKRIIPPIKLDKPGSAPQSPRFTTYKKLTTCKTLSELWSY
jgi:hypothetical protein